MRGWGLLRAASKLLALYFRHRHVAPRPLESQPNLASEISDAEAKAATSESSQEDDIPSKHTETSPGEKDGRPKHEALIPEDNKKAAAESYQEAAPPPKPVESDAKEGDAPSRPRRTLQRIIRRVMHLDFGNKVASGEAISDTGKKEKDSEIAAPQDGLQLPPSPKTSQPSMSEDDGKATETMTKPGRLWRILRSVMFLVNLRTKKTGGKAVSNTIETPIETKHDKPPDDFRRPLDLKSELKKSVKQHPEWPSVDEYLEKILENEGLKDMSIHFKTLTGIQKQCLLCFSIFKPFKRIRKRTMVYWWIGEGFAAPYGDKTSEEVAEEIFEELVEKEYIEPTLYNLCTGSILECSLHPFIHWMLKSKGRDAFFTDFDSRGKPVLPLFNSRRACLIGNKKPELLPETPSSKGDTSSADQTESTTSPQKIETTATPKKFDYVTSLCNKRKKSGPRSSQEEPNHLKEVPRLSVIFNLSSRYYSLDPNQFESLTNIIVLQLGRWHRESKVYIEVEDYQFLSSISHLKKLRYLGLQGMSRLTDLPIQFKELQRLVILDLRGCQNLEKLTEQVKFAKNLTHLDLTECYMLEHIPQGIGLLSQLQVFKGFVIGGSESRKTRCKLSELSGLKKLRKLSLNIPTEARIGQDEMSSLKKFERLQNLTITWGQLPIIVGNDQENEQKKQDLLERWTTLDPPPNLEKLDLRCYPKNKLPHWFTNTTIKGKLTNLYVRGGKLETIFPEKIEKITSSWNVKVLRLKYLKDFSMPWSEEVQQMLPHLERMEIVQCPKFISYPPVDQNGIWMNSKGSWRDVDSNPATMEAPSTDVQQTVDEPTLTPAAPTPTATPTTSILTPATPTPTATTDATKDSTPQPDTDKVPENTSGTIASKSDPIALHETPVPKPTAAEVVQDSVPSEPTMISEAEAASSDEDATEAEAASSDEDATEAASDSDALPKGSPPRPRATEDVQGSGSAEGQFTYSTADAVEDTSAPNSDPNATAATTRRSDSAAMPESPTHEPPATKVVQDSVPARATQFAEDVTQGTSKRSDSTAIPETLTTVGGVRDPAQALQTSEDDNDNTSEVDSEDEAPNATTGFTEDISAPEYDPAVSKAEGPISAADDIAANPSALTEAPIPKPPTSEVDDVPSGSPISAEGPISAADDTAANPAALTEAPIPKPPTLETSDKPSGDAHV